MQNPEKKFFVLEKKGLFSCGGNSSVIRHFFQLFQIA